MHSQIIFGLGLDGAPPLSSRGLGCAALGPRGFLDFLELHTGLRRKPVAASERLATFLGFLSQRKNSIPSFGRSFDLDAFATARSLLEWIDTWRLYGWDGSLPAGAPARLLELGSIASAMAGIVPPSEAERLAELRAALAGGAKLPPTTIQLCEPLSEHAPAWRPILDLLSCTLLDFPPAADPATDLGKLQRGLGQGQGGTQGQGIGSFAGDGSVVLRTTRTRTGAARWLAAREGRPGELVVLGGGGSLWDEACVGQGKPRPASSAGSAWRPGLQILPLALARHHEPFDLAGSLAFLVHPLCPLGFAGRFLAEGLAEDGGIGGQTWQRKLKDYEKLRLSYSWEGSAESLDKDLEAWLPAVRQPVEAIPIELLCEVTRSLSKWLRGRLHGKAAPAANDLRACENATEHCARFLQTLNCLGQSLTSIEARLVADLLTVSAMGIGERSSEGAELGSLPWVGDPAELVEPKARQLWFLPERPASPAAWPWPAAEVAALSVTGLDLPDLAELGARTARGWMRTLSLAGEAVKIILPPPGTEPHPLALFLQSVWPELVSSGIETELLSASQAGNLGGIEALTRIELPGLRRWWKVGSDAGPLEAGSFSHTQLEAFLSRPGQWLLHYRAGIRNSTILSTPDPATLEGRFAHALVEGLIDSFGDGVLALDEAAFGVWFDRAFSDLLQVQGALWLEEGQGQARLRLKSTLRASLRALLGQLRAAGATGIETEKDLAGSLFGLSFLGQADLVFSAASGRRCIVDMKNSRGVARFRDKISEDGDVQLTLYSELLAQQEGRLEPGRETEGAYWLIPAATLLSRNRIVFPEAETAESSRDQSGRLAMVEASYAWRRAQLASGQIEVVCAATAEDSAAATAPPKGVPFGAPFDRFDPYLALYGWSDTE